MNDQNPRRTSFEHGVGSAAAVSVISSDVCADRKGTQYLSPGGAVFLHEGLRQFWVRVGRSMRGV